jgi:hypothetical protein
MFHVEHFEIQQQAYQPLLAPPNSAEMLIPRLGTLNVLRMFHVEHSVQTQS